MTVSAVLLAGYNNKRAVEKYSRIVAESYHEKYIETGYKPLRAFSLHHHGKHVTKPLIQFTLEELLGDERISDVVIVGNKTLLEDKLLPLLESSEKPWKIIAQNQAFDSALVEEFGINLKRTAHDSIAGNMVKGYAATQAYTKGEPVLFAASDSPLTSMDFINTFLAGARTLAEQGDLIIPAIPMGILRDRMGRRPMLLINDTDKEVHCRKDLHGRCGFRLSSLIFCRLSGMNVNRLNDIYSMRKALSPKVQLRIFRICRELGYPGIYSKYFRKKNLSIRECENIMSRFIEGRVRAFPLEGENSTYDYDGTMRELKRITKMLKRKI